MSSLNSKDRVSLCLFTYADGRRCRLPRASKSSSRISTGAPHAGAPPSFSEGGSSHFCHYHAKKESRAATADNLAKDLAAFFSGHTVSANDLTTALARLLPAVVRGDIKPRAARTIAYMAQTLLQSIRLSQSEFKDAFGQDALRKSIRTGITSNHNRLFPPQPHAEPAADSSPSQSAPAKPAPTSKHVSSHPACHPGRSEGYLPDAAVPTNVETRPTLASTQPHAQPPQNDCRGGACSAPAACHPACPEEDRRERSEGSLLDPAAPTNVETRSIPAPAVPTTPEPRPTPSSQPVPQTPPPASPRQRPPSPHRDPYAIHFDDQNYRLREPEKAY